jgi:hypothetical protein
MRKLVLLLAALALVVVPTLAFGNPGSSHVPTTVPPGTTGPPSGTTGPDNAQHGTSGQQGPSNGEPSGGPPSDVPPSQAKALGKTQCQKFKTDFKNNKSAFGKCISAVAKGLQSSSPTKATFKSTCDKAGLSHKRAKGQKHSPYGACVAAGARALRS